MASWPSIATPSKIKESAIKKVIRTTSEGGYIQARARWTDYKQSFELIWSVLTSTDKATLITFFDTNQGTTFTWTHPELATTHTCFFSDDQIVFSSLMSGKWSCKVNIIEQQ